MLLLRDARLPMRDDTTRRGSPPTENPSGA
jgi:hypothetical protein